MTIPTKKGGHLRACFFFGHIKENPYFIMILVRESRVSFRDSQIVWLEEKRDGGERVDLTTTLAVEHGMQLKKKKKIP